MKCLKDLRPACIVSFGTKEYNYTITLKLKTVPSRLKNQKSSKTLQLASNPNRNFKEDTADGNTYKT